MTPEERNRLLMLIADPPPGSKIEAPEISVVDLTLLVQNLPLLQMKECVRWKARCVSRSNCAKRCVRPGNDGF